MLFNKSESVDSLKNKARRLLTKIRIIESEYNCGRSLIGALNPEYCKLQSEFEETMKKLKKEDPNFPKG